MKKDILLLGNTQNNQLEGDPLGQAMDMKMPSGFMTTGGGLAHTETWVRITIMFGALLHLWLVPNQIKIHGTTIGILILVMSIVMKLETI